MEFKKSQYELWVSVHFVILHTIQTSSQTNEAMIINNNWALSCNSIKTCVETPVP